MTQFSRHIIRRQVLEIISNKAEENANQLHEQAKMLYNKHFLPIIERCFDKVDIPNQHIRLDSFVVDIEKGDILNPDATWLKMAIQNLEENLMQALQAALSNNHTKFGQVPNFPELDSTFETQNNPKHLPSHLSNSSGEMGQNPLNELLYYFLNTGQLPWWADANDRQIIDKTVVEILQKQSENILIWFKNNHYRFRFIRNVSDETLILLYKTTEPVREKGINDVNKSLKTLTSQMERIFFWEEIFIKVGVLKSRVKSREISNQLELSSDLPPQYFSEKDTKKVEIEATQENEYQTTNKFGTVLNSSELMLDLVDRPSQYLTEKDSENVEKKAQKQSKQSFIEQNKDEHLYIQNAGLVLLAAYLPMFFENLGWIAEKKFIDESKSELAVQAIQYLVDGQDDAPEFLLTLPKILCGFSPNTLLTLERGLTDDEKKEADSFLMAILENTPELGLKTPDALRGSFLLRQGVLEQTESQWILHVEVETFDLILHKIPWNFQITKLPWMKIPIFIDWALPNF